MDTPNEVELTPEQVKEKRLERQRRARREWYYRNKEKVSEQYYKARADAYLKKHEKIMKVIGACSS
jgi:hypothetical protein